MELYAQSFKFVATLRRSRLLSGAAGVLLLTLAFWGYHLHSEASRQETAGLASVPRLSIADFKGLYDSWVIPSDAYTASSGQSQRIDQLGLYIIDVRSPELYAAGHIRGAVSMPETDLEGRIGEVVSPARSDALIVLYCA